MRRKRFNMESEKQKKRKKGLLRRFLPYMKPHRQTIAIDLLCASLTCLCDLVLPLILRTITNTASTDLASLTVSLVLKMALLYFVLRIIDAAAQYYMADMGHVMGVYIETKMREDAFSHLQLLGHNYYSNTKIGQIMGRITNDLFEVTEFAHHCPEEFFTLIMRRFMMRISQRVADQVKAKALVTGENLGQVASQTMEALRVTEDVVDLPVLRPLIGMDKEEIVRLSRKIGTFDTSILPYEDCCTVFTPRHPRTKPNLDEVREAEAVLDIEGLIDRAMTNREFVRIKF